MVINIIEKVSPLMLGCAQFSTELLPVWAWWNPILYMIHGHKAILSPLSALLYTKLFSLLRRACQSTVTVCQYGKSAGCVWLWAFRQSAVSFFIFLVCATLINRNSSLFITFWRKSIGGYLVCRKKFVSLQLTVCHDDEMTLGSGSFSGISQQLPKRW